MDFTHEDLIDEAVAATMVTHGGVTLRDLKQLPFPDYERVLQRIPEIARQMARETGGR